MSGLADLSLKTDYRKGRDDIAHDFYLPCMRIAERYDRAVGFFNLGTQPLQADFSDFAKLNLTGKQTARDLWRQQNMATVDTAKDFLPLTVPAHGVVLYKFSKVK